MTDYTPTVFAIIVSATALIYSTYTDLKDHTIQPVICLIVVVLAAIEPGKDYLNGLYGLLIGFIPLFLAARVGNGGDGDALLAGALGFLLGFQFNAYMCLIAYTLYVIVLTFAVLITRDRKKQYPFVPYMACGWIAVIALSRLQIY